VRGAYVRRHKHTHTHTHTHTCGRARDGYRLRHHHAVTTRIPLAPRGFTPGRFVGSRLCQQNCQEAARLARMRAGTAAGAAAVCAVLTACAVVWSTGGRGAVVLGELPPGTRLLADALRDVATATDARGHAAVRGNGGGKGGGGGEAAAAGASGVGVPDSASVHAMKLTGLERLALGMRKMSPLASMPRLDPISPSSLPAAGSHAWEVAKTKATVRVSSLQLKLDRQQRRLDVESAEHAALLNGPVGAELNARQALADRVKHEVAAAKSMEAKARKLSDKVVSDLHVQKGHYDIKQWYRSQSAFKSSEESTDAVSKAKKLWAKAMADRQALRKVVGPIPLPALPAFAPPRSGSALRQLSCKACVRAYGAEERARCFDSARHSWQLLMTLASFAAHDA